MAQVRVQSRSHIVQLQPPHIITIYMANILIQLRFVSCFNDVDLWRHLRILVLTMKGQITIQVNNFSPKISYTSIELVKKKSYQNNYESGKCHFSMKRFRILARMPYLQYIILFSLKSRVDNFIFQWLWRYLDVSGRILKAT